MSTPGRWQQLRNVAIFVLWTGFVWNLLTAFLPSEEATWFWRHLAQSLGCAGLAYHLMQANEPPRRR